VLSGQSSGRRRTDGIAPSAVRRDVRAQTRRWPSGRKARPATAPRSASTCARRGSRTASKTNWRLASRFGSFDAEALFFGHQPNDHSSHDYERFVYRALGDDLRDGDVADGASPVKSAADAFRDLPRLDAIWGSS
jgi:hypothetical protein